MAAVDVGDDAERFHAIPCPKAFAETPEQMEDTLCTCDLDRMNRAKEEAVKPTRALWCPKCRPGVFDTAPTCCDDQPFVELVER